MRRDKFNARCDFLQRPQQRSFQRDQAMIERTVSANGGFEMKLHSVIGGGGVKLHVREWGESSAPAILLIHGWSQNHLCWRKQYESELAEEFRLVAFDLRGHGMSDAPQA